MVGQIDTFHLLQIWSTYFNPIFWWWFNLSSFFLRSWEENSKKHQNDTFYLVKTFEFVFLEGGRKEGWRKKRPQHPGLEPGTYRVLDEGPQLHATGVV